MSGLSSETFRENAVAALADPQLHAALQNLAKTFGGKRKVAISSVLSLWGVPDDPTHNRWRTFATGGCSGVVYRLAPGATA